MRPSEGGRTWIPGPPASTSTPAWEFFWVIGWMFTIAFAKLIWWQALLGLVVWPYYLGLAVR